MDLAGLGSGRSVPYLMRRVQSALIQAKSCKEVGFTPQAAELWPSLYEKLTQEQTGTLASMTSRAAPNVRRLALLYALLDQAVAVDVPHLNAALALWNYCFASADFCWLCELQVRAGLRTAHGEGLLFNS